MGRCENGFDSQRKCQCDSMCKYYQSCCSDFEATCGMMSTTTSPLICLKYISQKVQAKRGDRLTSLSSPFSSWGHLCVCRGRWRAVWRHHSTSSNSSGVFHPWSSSAGAHWADRLRLWPQAPAASRDHTGNGQTISAESPLQTDDTYFTPTYRERPLHNQTPWDGCSSWDDHRPHHQRHHGSPWPGCWGLQREVLWLFYAAKKWLYICLQRWVTPYYSNIVISGAC